MPVETELKLLIDPQHIARLRRHPLFKRGRRLAPQKLYSVYYDTPDLALWRHGVALRLRRAGRRWVQTVKGGGSVVAGLHQRPETEAAIDDAVPDFAAIEDPMLARYFSTRKLRARLKPAVVTRFTRASYLLQPQPGVVIEASLDRGTLEGGGRSEPICELELEMKSGPAWHAHQVALQLLATAPLLAADRSKAERGFDLHRNAAPKPRKARASPLTPDMTCRDAFEALVEAGLAHFLANQHGLLNDDDPEYLHQMRVALRRLRSVLATFAPLFTEDVLAARVTEIRRLSAVLGRARDWDVFVTETLPPLTQRYAKHAGIAAFCHRAAWLRMYADRAARRAVGSRRGQHFILASGAWLLAGDWFARLDAAQRAALLRPVTVFAREVLDGAHARVLKRGRHFGRLTPPKLHRLRIAAKKLRYAADFFAPLYDRRRVSRFRDTLAQLQDALGSFNDAVTTARLVEEARRGLTSASAREARGILLGWSGGVQHSGGRHLKLLWDKWRAMSPFWKDA
ncbi:MAG TPA: CHAD domain-containing protein [Burkholderiales bacterium]|nr:CHAD domain-containing protein [Burkholderiales bacterium]